MNLQMIVLISSYILTYCGSAKILGYFHVPSISHQVVYQAIWRELSLRGHEVTVITPDPIKDTKLVNLTEIDVHHAYEEIMKCDLVKNLKKDKFVFQNVLHLYECYDFTIEAEMKHPDVRKLLNDNEHSFDLVMVEALHPIDLGFAHRYKVPIVGISSLGAFLQSHDAMGNPTHPVLNPCFMMPLEGNPTFFDKISSTLYHIYYRLLYYGYLLPKSDKIARKYFGNDMPYLGDIEKNMSLLLLNVNPIMHPIRPNVPAIIEISQMHIKPEGKLPNDLQEYLDKSPEGVIYFSLGSNVKSANLSKQTRTVIIQALSELPYNVLWKWETDYLPGKPENVMTKKWLPQQDVLRHPNVKVFVTQCGIQSTEEAISFGVPMIGMPFFADQPLNAVKMVNLGVARSVNYATMTKDELKDAITDVIENKKYREKIIKLQKILTDQPMSGPQKAVWWIEYVLRHNGAYHLRSPAADMSWIEYFLLDIIALFLALAIVCVFLIYITVFKRNNKNNKIKKQ